MAIKKASPANEGSGYYSIPSDFVPPNQKKEKGYILQYMQAMYGIKVRQEGYYQRENNRIISNRKYAEGLQSVNKYKSVMGVDSGDTSYLNLDWSAVSVITKFVNLRVGEMINQDYRVAASAIDPTSKSAKDEERNKYLANMKLKELSDELEKVGGIKLMDSDEYVPEDKEELDIHMQLNFKQATEIATEEIIDFEFTYNEWDKLMKLIARDLVVIKRSALRFYFDENHRVRFRYADWANMVFPFSTREDLSDCKYIGEIIKMPIHEIRRAAKNDKTPMTEEDLWTIAKYYSGKEGNRKWTYGDTFHKYYYDGIDNLYTEYDDFLIPVLDGTFISIDVLKYEKKQNNHKGYWYEERDYSYVPPEGTTKERRIDSKELERVYQGKWIIGTDHIFNYGLAEDVPRDVAGGKVSARAQLPYVCIFPDQKDMENKSDVEKMIPHEDAINIISLKTQHLIAKLTPPGLAIDIQALNDVVLGKGKEWQPLQLQQLYEALGTYYYKGSDEEGNPINQNPIREIKNTLGPVLQELVFVYNHHMQQIRDITGINEARDSSQPDQDAGLGVKQLALQASRNVTRPIDYAFRDLMEMAAKRTNMMVLHNIRHKRNLELYKNAIGSEKVKTLDLVDGFRSIEMGIKIEAILNEDDKMGLERDINQSIAQGELRIEDAIMIRQIPNIKLANQFLIHRRKRYRKEVQEEAAANAQMNAQVQTQAAEAKAQADVVKIEAQKRAELEKTAQKLALQEQYAQKEHERKLEIIRLEGDIKSDHIEEAAQEDFKKTALTESVRQPKVNPSTPNA